MKIYTLDILPDGVFINEVDMESLVSFVDCVEDSIK